MTLNPAAAVFVPSMKTLRFAQTSPVPPSVSVGHVATATAAAQQQQQQANYGHLPPPQLAPLYVNASEVHKHHHHHQTTAHHDEPEDAGVDYSTFDLPFFFHDMMTADGDDFLNYLPYRAEYLLGYATTSSANALEVVETVLDWAFLRPGADPKPSERALQLAAEMADMDVCFYQKLFHKLNQDIVMHLQRLRTTNRSAWVSWPSDDVSGPLCVMLGRVLRALHVGTCVQPPNQVPRFAENACLFITEMLKRKTTIDAAIRCLEQGYPQLRAIAPPLYLDTLHGSLQSPPFPLGGDSRRRLTDLQRWTRQHFNNNNRHSRRAADTCHKTHAIPVAELNEEENEDFELFLRESQGMMMS